MTRRLTQVYDGHTVYYEFLDTERPGLRVVCRPPFDWLPVLRAIIEYDERPKETQTAFEVGGEGT